MRTKEQLSSTVLQEMTIASMSVREAVGKFWEEVLVGQAEESTVARPYPFSLENASNPAEKSRP
jgi:hypothetical protein